MEGVVCLHSHHNQPVPPVHRKWHLNGLRFSYLNLFLMWSLTKKLEEAHKLTVRQEFNDNKFLTLSHFS